VAGWERGGQKKAPLLFFWWLGKRKREKGRDGERGKGERWAGGRPPPTTTYNYNVWNYRRFYVFYVLSTACWPLASSKSSGLIRVEIIKTHDHECSKS
jgi:hypothetical protein